MTPEEARAGIAACICTGGLTAAGVLGVIRLFTEQFGALCSDTDSPLEFMFDQAVLVAAWFAMFLIGMAISGGAVLGWNADVPVSASLPLFSIAGQIIAYFGVSWGILLYRHFVLYNGVKGRLATYAMWRKASRRIDWEIGSSTHVQELEDAYADLKAKGDELDSSYSPFRFEVKSWKFTAAMLIVRTVVALAVAKTALLCAGGST